MVHISSHEMWVVHKEFQKEMPLKFKSEIFLRMGLPKKINFSINIKINNLIAPNTYPSFLILSQLLFLFPLLSYQHWCHLINDSTMSSLVPAQPNLCPLWMDFLCPKEETDGNETFMFRSSTTILASLSLIPVQNTEIVYHTIFL